MPTDFSARLRAAHTALRGRGLNLVALSDLRAALADLDRETFDRELYAVRAAGGAWLHTFDGRHGRVTPEQAAAAIVEDGRTFVFVALRDDDETEPAPMEPREALLTRALLALARADEQRIRRVLAVLE